MSATLSRPVSDRLLDARIVMLTDEVSDESADTVIAQLLAGLAVYDVMQLIPNDVVTVATGLAASMGPVLMRAGAAGKRFGIRRRDPGSP